MMSRFWNCGQLMLFVFLLVCCSDGNREHVVAKGKEKINEKIRIGDDVFEAKRILESEGLSVIGPSFATEDKSYYIMTIDLGIHPNLTDTARYILDLGDGGKRIYGIIRAKPSGEIIEIE